MQSLLWIYRYKTKNSHDESLSTQYLRAVLQNCSYNSCCFTEWKQDPSCCSCTSVIGLQSVWVDPLVGAFVAKPDSLHELVCFCWSTTERKKCLKSIPAPSCLTWGHHEQYPPAVFIRNGFRLLFLYLMKKRGEDPPRLP